MDDEMRAALRPVRSMIRIPHVAVAVLVSDASAFAVLGLSPRQFRALVRKHGIAHAKVARRTVARVDAVLRALGLVDAVEVAQPVWDEDAAIADAIRPRGSR